MDRLKSRQEHENQHLLIEWGRGMGSRASCLGGGATQGLLIELGPYLLKSREDE